MKDELTDDAREAFIRDQNYRTGAISDLVRTGWDAAMVQAHKTGLENEQLRARIQILEEMLDAWEKDESPDHAALNAKLVALRVVLENCRRTFSWLLERHGAMSAKCRIEDIDKALAPEP